MAQIDATAAVTLSSRKNPVASLLSALGAMFFTLSEAGPRMDQIRKLNATSDEALAARGTDRAAEVRRIFAGSYYL